jgi:putative transposase
MSRLPRYALPGIPQHIIQRGHNRRPIFFHADDYRFSLVWLQETTAIHATPVHTYVLMTNHVHLLLTPH